MLPEIAIKYVWGHPESVFPDPKCKCLGNKGPGGAHSAHVLLLCACCSLSCLSSSPLPLLPFSSSSSSSSYILGFYKCSDSLREIASCLYQRPTYTVGRQGSNVGDETSICQASYVGFWCSGQNCGCTEGMKMIISILIMSNLSDRRGMLVASTSIRESWAVDTG